MVWGWARTKVTPKAVCPSSTLDKVNPWRLSDKQFYKSLHRSAIYREGMSSVITTVGLTYKLLTTLWRFNDFFVSTRILTYGDSYLSVPDAERQSIDADCRSSSRSHSHVIATLKTSLTQLARWHTSYGCHWLTWLDYHRQMTCAPSSGTLKHYMASLAQSVRTVNVLKSLDPI